MASNIGWLAESALIPRPSKEIKVESGTMLDLKAQIAEGKEKHIAIKHKHNQGEAKNKGVELRIKEDSLKNTIYKQNLVEKSNLYNDLRDRSAPVELGRRFLVDFDSGNKKKKSEINAKYQRQEEERVKWEKATKQKILDDTIDNILKAKKPVVRQAWENTLSANEKQCLPEAIEEISKIQSTHEMVRKKREEMKQARERIILQLINSKRL